MNILNNTSTTRGKPRSQWAKDTEVYIMISDLLEQIKDSKPNDKSDKDKSYSVLKMDVEKIYAYFKVFILEE
jgi:hypothetical protein